MIAAHRHAMAANPGKVAALRALFPQFRSALGHLASMSRRELVSGEQLVHWRAMPNDQVGFPTQLSGRQLKSAGLLHFRTQRWPDVLRCFPAEKRWYGQEYECAATAMATTALASLGVFEDAFRRGGKAAGDERVPQAATVALYTQAMCLRHLDREDEAGQLLRRVYSRDAKFGPAREALDDPSRRLVLTDPETIEARVDPWDPSSAPTRQETEVARHAEEASRYLAEGEAELNAMLGMEAAKREIKRIRSTTKVNLARAKVGLPVPVASRHTLRRPDKTSILAPQTPGPDTFSGLSTVWLTSDGCLRRTRRAVSREGRRVGPIPHRAKAPRCTPVRARRRR
jgi:hypothetical protein